MSTEKNHILWKKNKPKEYEELTEWEFFEKIKQEIAPLQESLSKKSITVNEAKGELKKINEWIKWTNLKKEKQQELWSAFDKLTKNLEKNINQNNLQTEFNEIVTLLENLTQGDLATLNWDIQKKRWNSERPDEVQKWIDIASNNLDKTINNAAEEDGVPGFFWRIMQKLNS
jgi:hypothetical protein